MSSSALQIRLDKTSKASLFNQHREILVVILVGLVVMLPAIVFGIPSNRDLSNHFRFALPFYDSLNSGNFFPGWLAESNGGYGDASFRFYPPALYYLLALSRSLTSSWYVGTLVTFTAIWIAGSLGLYLWASTILSSRNAMWASVLFLLMPYHLNQYYQATMLAEFAGTSILPFCFYFVERICRGNSKRSVAGLAISYSALLLTHLPLAVIGSLALFVYSLSRLPQQHQVKTCGRLIVATVLGLAVSARYWTTVIAEQSWIRADNILPDPSVDYRVNFIFSTFSPDNLNVWWMNFLLLATFAMLWPALSQLWSPQTNPATEQSRFSTLQGLTLLLLLTIFMATPISRPIWHVLRPLQQTQFPWRWLAITSMAAPILIAASIPYWQALAKGKKRPLAILAAGTVVVSIAFSASHTVREAKYLNTAEFNKTLGEIPGSASVSQWWPSWVHEPLKKMNSPVDAGEREVVIQNWEPEHRKFLIGAGQASQVRVLTFFYPHWKASAEGKQLEVHPAADGALVINAPQDASSIVLEFSEPVRIRIAGMVSVLGCVLTCGLLFHRKRNSVSIPRSS